MFDAGIMEYLNPDFIFGFVGGIIVTAFFALFLTRFAADKMGRVLKKWEKIGCAFFAALMVSLAWGFRSGGVDWTQIPGNVLVYGTISGFVYENIIKPLVEKLNNRPQG